MQTYMINGTSFSDVIFTIIDKIPIDESVSFSSSTIILFGETNTEVSLNDKLLRVSIMKKIKTKGKIQNIQQFSFDKKIVTECFITFDTNNIIFISDYLEYRIIIKNIPILDQIANCLNVFDNSVKKRYRILFKNWIWDYENYKYITFKDYGFHDKFLIEKYGFKIVNFTDKTIYNIKTMAKLIDVKKLVSSLRKDSLLSQHLTNLHLYNNDILSFIMSRNNIYHNIILSAYKTERNEYVGELYKIMQEFPIDCIFARIM